MQQVLENSCKITHPSVASLSLPAAAIGQAPPAVWLSADAAGLAAVAPLPVLCGCCLSMLPLDALHRQLGPVPGSVLPP